MKTSTPERAVKPGGAIVWMWLAGPTGKEVSASIDRLARSDDVRHVAIMPDVHLAHDVCIGTVLATSRLIYPAAVGGDIGCGISTQAFDPPEGGMIDARSAARILEGLRRAVPIIRHGTASRPTLPDALFDVANPPSTPGAERSDAPDPSPGASADDSCASERVPTLAKTAETIHPTNPMRKASSPSDSRIAMGEDAATANAIERPAISPFLEAILRRDGRVQFGTLGRGNHFLELQTDEEGRLWAMVHSGSRAVGPAVRDWRLARAVESSSGLLHLDAETPAGQAYLADMAFARRWASLNRLAMLRAAADVLSEVIDAKPDPATLHDCDHNHVRRETHFGGDFWVHRKGAMPAAAGQPGVIPGSMGTPSFHVEGRGCEAALRSSSHGAGRAMSRHDARRTISAKDLKRQLADVWVDPRVAPLLSDEAPAAYKDVRAVLRAQRDLTRIVRTLRPVLSYKGAG